MSDEIMEIIHSIAEESMKQEQDRSSALHSKAEKLVTYISIVIGLINSALVFLLEHNILNSNGLISSALWINIPFFIGFLFAIQAQRTLKRLNYPSGLQVLRDIARASATQTKRDIQFYQLRCMGIYTETLSDVNNIRARLIALAHLSCILGFLAILWHGYSIFPGASEILWCQTAVAVMGIYFYCVSN